MEHILKTAVVFVVMLGILVIWHELGHFIVAKLTRMKVHEFAVGFGPRIAKLFKRGDTEFSVRAVPLGGFVRIAGMEPGDEEEGGFNAAPISHRAAVVFAGPMMSLILGYLVLLLIGFIWGYGISNSRLDKIVPKSPAASVGLKSGDVVLAINNERLDDGYWLRKIYHKPTGDGYELRKIVSRNAGKNIDLLVSRENRQFHIKVKPMGDKDSGDGRLGVLMKDSVVRPGIAGSLAWGTIETYRYISDTVAGIFSKKIAKEAGGIVMIGYITSETVKAGIQWVIFELAMLSLAIGIMNLIPWPMLDGGHLLLIGIEKIRRRKMQPETWMKVQTFGVVVLMALMIFLIGFDIFRIASGKLPQ